MFVVTPLVSENAPLARSPAHGTGRIVWQRRYDGIAHVAYRGGKAIAGVSGPWSDRYALIWWDERPVGSNPLELFETVAAAMRAVEERIGLALPQAVAGGPRREPRRNRWAGIFFGRHCDGRIARLRRDSLGAETDLSGLNFCASR